MKAEEYIEDHELELARNLVMQHGWNTMAYQILNPGISLWFSQDRCAVIGYVQTPTHVIAAGSPVCAEAQTEKVVLEFYRYVSARNKKVSFFGAQERIVTMLAHHSPVSSILLGSQPIWRPSDWLSSVHTKSSLRAQVKRAKNKSVTAALWREGSSIPISELAHCLDEWIASRRLPPMHFLVEPNTLDGLKDRIVVVAQLSNRVVGFCIASPIPLRNGWLIEQIVRGTTAPNGTAELLLEYMITHLRDIGASIVTLGLSPLSKNYCSPYKHPLWLRTSLQFTKLYGRSLYNFDGLNAFKAKFLPREWEPVFAITNEKAPTISTLYAIATAFSGMSPVRFVLKGIVRTVVR